MNLLDRDKIIAWCAELLEAKVKGCLGECIMPEDTNPGFAPNEQERRLSYFTLPMALNYQRDSYALWKAAKSTYEDADVTDVFDVVAVASMPPELLRQKLLKYKVALQPNKHVDTWRRIAATVSGEWGSLEVLFSATNFDFLELRGMVQGTHKAGFPYLSGPKIFNYWSCIIQEYGGLELKHSDEIGIAPDTHIIKCSVKLGVITQQEAESLSREMIAQRWHDLLKGSGITPNRLHPALWFWSRGGFVYQLESN